jgi:hypothetical protein
MLKMVNFKQLGCLAALFPSPCGRGEDASRSSAGEVYSTRWNYFPRSSATQAVTASVVVGKARSGHGMSSGAK